MATDLVRARADEERQRWALRMQQQAETAARAERALAAALEAKIAAELETANARNVASELKQELLLQRSITSGVGDSTFAYASPADNTQSEASPADTPSSASSSAARQHTHQKMKRLRRRRPVRFEREVPEQTTVPDQTVHSTSRGRGSQTPLSVAAAKAACDAETSRTTERQLEPSITGSTSRLKQAQRAYETGVSNTSIDPPRVVVRRRRQRPGSAPAFRHTPTHAGDAAHGEVLRSERGNRNGDRDGDSQGKWLVKGRQAALQLPLQPPARATDANSSITSGDRVVAAVSTPATGWVRPRHIAGARRRQRGSSARTTRAVAGSKRRPARHHQQQPPMVMEQTADMSTRALYHLDAYTTAGRSRRTLEW
jgi:hypothetical protein